MTLHLQIFHFLEVNLVEEHLVQDDAKVGDEQIFVLKLSERDMKPSAASLSMIISAPHLRIYLSDIVRRVPLTDRQVHC